VVEKTQGHVQIVIAKQNRDIRLLIEDYINLLLYIIGEIAAQSPVTSESNVRVDGMTPSMCHSDLFR
jgi:hypothetical protein